MADLQGRLDVAEQLLAREGYRRCDVPACNCGSWHKTSAAQLLTEARPVARIVAFLRAKAELVALAYGPNDVKTICHYQNDARVAELRRMADAVERGDWRGDG